MKDLMEKWNGTPYPDMIRKLPEVDVPVEGVRAWLIQSESQQVVFFDLPQGSEVPSHSHFAQWGLVVEGEMRLTIGDRTDVYRKGDWYYIPEGVAHSAIFHTRVYVIDVFDAPDRYRAKREKE